MSTYVSYKKQIIFSIIFLLVIIASIEGVLRIVEFSSVQCGLLDSDSYDDLDYFSIRDICVDVKSILYYEEPIHHMRPDQNLKTINVNSLGFRGPEITVEKPDNTFRVFVLGGSSTFGSGATADDNTIPGYLQKKFNDYNLTSSVQVINAGVVSATSFEENYYIKNNILNLNPDLIVIYDGSNDAKYRILSDKIIYDTVKPEEEWKFKNFPYYRTPFVINDLFFSRIPHQESSTERLDFESTEIIVSLWEKRVIEICKLGKEKEFETLILVQPTLYSGSKPLTDFESKFDTKTESDLAAKQTLKLMAERLKELSKYCHTSDLTNIFDNITIAIYTDYIHTNDKGNEIIAEKIFELSYPIILENNL